MMKSKKIVFTGGGTVGHVTLNLILIPKFIEDGYEVHYIGSKNGIEYQEIKKLNLPITFHSIATGKLRRYFSWQNLKDIFKVAWGIIQSLVIIAKLRPSALFSKGGFVSVPPVIAAKTLGVPVFVHESDLSMGLANKIAYRFATKMYTTFDQSNSSSKMKHVGAITKISDDKADFSLIADILDYFDPNLPTLLFVGGSAGAKIFNDFVTKNKEQLKSYNVINISGDSSLNELEHQLYRVDYVTKTYQSLVSKADVVVTRGGSNTIFELLAMAKPHIIVPLGREASRGDQIENAAYFVKKGYAKAISESDFNFDNLDKNIKDLLIHKNDYIKNMKATQEIKSQQDFYQMLLEDMSNQK
ncbi:hypothetical protein HMPREF9318_01399 [Streptococcus urinalis FB127-CNA-2]|uniref:UDP-N-acetylglucosamine--N-acetylmuramyl-(pentapeptide) pyrophosphoryl-undecaprenol N-acetylglucosamine transferase n=1 Tax=Streptococcus urinalis 2285-97 TaxID=764291 RepID=G5KD59_9STRE|nr:UDP-N-acetylglucosamine--N-acetylmuramyl-(pentapeptide) pyrophosphoryl-undecaprenol N-acetylglucosamine transferase [Streptococcus urinalis]EHJ55965.1 glycosyltransferase family 28 N-terminal domain protein [Streptococcus urinalis 2285-97]EKS19323.1 hypothetical protein HMPREF9318_01399 [Streptococcus urinalis FB127-CNA-2]VEF31454.1 UDP-N-acetylglucosamine:LPS N-acetylglucosamine transferase [Streptococcus urinalis]